MGPRAESYDLFLCHAWDDRRETATELHDLLEAQDVSVWLSEWDIILGLPFMREIDKAWPRRASVSSSSRPPS
ncbi:toll/interleukin-1 receptor domain-containing protein [Nocardia pneumoniae]|uniref:toll/interleukin-1 receptor domain-containing protein n=1 Tax=Nocardia pneumoniae TaxID=228601 RepID=UPI000319F4E1